MQWNILQINQNLTRKYDIHFNFFLTKPANELIFNQTLAPTTIAFKDAAILADSNEYFKRYYFLKNALDKDEIYDRINLLAEFYASAVLLKYEYPMMVLTNTKSVFLKRLKRMKKILVEEGSSDQSKSNVQQKPVSINSSQFLKSVNQSQLQLKSIDEDSLKLQFSLLDDNTEEIHNIFEENEEEDEQDVGKALFLANIDRLTQQISSQLVLKKEQTEQDLQHLVIDFQEIDREYIVSQYQKLMDKQNRSAKSNKQINHQRAQLNNRHTPVELRELINIKPMAQSFTIPVRSNINNNITQSDLGLKRLKKTPSRLVEQRKDAPMQRSSYYNRQIDYYNKSHKKDSPIPEDDREYSPKSIQRGSKHRQFMSNTKNEFRFGSPRKDYIANTKLNLKDLQATRQRLMERYEYQPLMKYSSIQHHRKQSKLRKRNRFTQLQEQQEENNYPFISTQENYQCGINQQYDRDQYKHSPQLQHATSHPSLSNRLTSININNLEEKNELALINLNLKNNKFAKAEQFQHNQRDQRAEKKRKIRERAAALLVRVKSHEYLRTTVPQPNRYYDYGLSHTGGYYEHNY